MTDPRAPAGGPQPGTAGPPVPGSCADPGAEEAGHFPCDPEDASAEPAFEEPSPGGSAGQAGADWTETEAGFLAGQLQDLTQYLDDTAETRATLLAAVVPKVSVTGYTSFASEQIKAALASNLARYAMPDFGLKSALAASIPDFAGLIAPTLNAVAKSAVLPDPGFFRHSLQAGFLASGLPGPAFSRHFLMPAPDLGFARDIAEMASSWDRGLLRQIAESTVAPIQGLLRSMSDFSASWAGPARSLADFTAASTAAAVGGLLRSWGEMAETGRGLLRNLARAAYRAAVRARRAVLDEDEELVAWFIEDWLCMPITPARIEAVSVALLDEGWDARIPEHPAFLLDDLRDRTRRHSHILKPYWETQLNHRAVGSLSQVITAVGGAALTAADLVADPWTTEDLALARECEEQRLDLVLSQLKPGEQRIAKVWAEHSELTWAEAALLAGAPDPAAAGERVRRKLKRLGDREHGRRLARAGRA
jgi:hypothetical protein